MEKQLFLKSEFFTLAELTKSATAQKHHLTNDPDNRVIENLQYGCDMVLDPLRRMLGKPIVVTSGYRSHIVNKLVGGVKNSWHQDGNAVDLRIYDEDDAQKKFQLLQKIPSVDTCLFEHSATSKWLHVQWNKAKTPRHHFNYNYHA